MKKLTQILQRWWEYTNIRTFLKANIVLVYLLSIFCNIQKKKYIFNTLWNKFSNVTLKTPLNTLPFFCVWGGEGRLKSFLYLLNNYLKTPTIITFGQFKCCMIGRIIFSSLFQKLYQDFNRDLKSSNQIML